MSEGSAARRRGRYLAYNRAIAADAQTRFPATVTCKTAHALAAVSRLVSEETADVTVSTAHKAKGREWATARIADDYAPPTPPAGSPQPAKAPPVDDAEARLAYVAVTRARARLDRGGLSWVDGYLAEPETASLAGAETTSEPSGPVS